MGGADGDPPASTAGDLYADVVQKQLADEDQRKGSIEQRGAAVVTTSGVLIALLFGFAGFTTTAPGFRAAGATGLLLAFALVAFLIAAVLGILSNWLLNYPVMSHAALTALINQSDKPYPPARYRVSEARIAILTGARQQNTRKALALTGAQSFQVLALVLAGLAVLTIVLASSPGATTKSSPSPTASAQPSAKKTIAATPGP